MMMAAANTVHAVDCTAAGRIDTADLAGRTADLAHATAAAAVEKARLWCAAPAV